MMSHLEKCALAADGGTPQRRTPFAPWPHFDDEQVEAAAAVLRSGKVNYWTGTESRQFESEFAQLVGTKHAIAVANGTVAIELALYALGIGPGDEVIVPSRTFVATASAVAVRGATPVFADVDFNSQNVTVETIEAQITPRTRGVIVVHLAGWPCEMDAICSMARRRGLKVIEDCAQAHGAAWKGQPVGSFGDMSAFSFCQDKIMTTAGEGGMVVTNDSKLWETAWCFKDHGKSWDKMTTPASGATFRYVHDSIGTNWRLTEVQSAVGRIALRQLPSWVSKRRQLADRLQALNNRQSALRLTVPPTDAYHSYYKYYAFLRTEKLRSDWTRDRILNSLQAEGIPCGSGTCPEIYQEGAFLNSPFGPAERFPIAQKLGATSLMFQVHPTLSPADIDDVAQALGKVLDHATVQDLQSRREAA